MRSKEKEGFIYRLYDQGLYPKFEKAIADKKRRKAVMLLKKVSCTSEEIEKILDFYKLKKKETWYKKYFNIESEKEEDVDDFDDY